MLHVFSEVDSKNSESEWNQDSDAPQLQYFDDRKESIHRLSPSQCILFYQSPLCAETIALKY